jgi:hypothetical protein
MQRWAGLPIVVTKRHFDQNTRFCVGAMLNAPRKSRFLVATDTYPKKLLSTAVSVTNGTRIAFRKGTSCGPLFLKGDWGGVGAKTSWTSLSHSVSSQRTYSPPAKRSNQENARSVELGRQNIRTLMGIVVVCVSAALIGWPQEATARTAP